jgi:hypothetical protein
LLRRFPRYNQNALAPHSNSRFLTAILFAAAAYWVAGCTAAFGPGYTIEKQEIRVHFVSAPEPRLSGEAEYKLLNNGNQPLSELELRLPGRRRFHFSNPRAEWDGVSLAVEASPANARNNLLKFPQPWLVSSVHTLHLSVEFDRSEGEGSMLTFAEDAFFLPSEGWSPELLPSRGFFATGGTPPKKWELEVRVPDGFRVHTSGDDRKKSRKDGELIIRAQQEPQDRYPFVIAGKYKEAQIGNEKQKVFLWTRKAQEEGGLGEASNALVRTTQVYDQLFGSRDKKDHPLWMVECPVIAGCFINQGGRNAQLLGEDGNRPSSAQMASLDTVMVDVSSGMPNLAASAGPSLAASWLGYGRNPGFYEQDLPLSAFPAFAAAEGRDAVTGSDARAETIRRALRLIPKDSGNKQKEDDAVLRAKSFLFFYALQDRYGAEVFRKATSHMFYARQGHGFNLNDLISAFDEESHQNTAEFVRHWMKRPGVPADFRARYETSSSATAVTTKETTP